MSDSSAAGSGAHLPPLYLTSIHKVCPYFLPQMEESLLLKTAVTSLIIGPALPQSKL